MSLDHKESGAVGSNLSNSNILLPNEFKSSGSSGLENSTSLPVNHPTGREDPQIYITECKNFFNDYLPAETICLDEPKSSSSFGGSFCDHENGLGFGDQEVDSTSYKEHSLPFEFDPPNVLFGMGKPKLSDEWRKFCQPVILRCKWLELKVKELQFQARKYDKQLDEYYAKRQSELEKQKSDGIDKKSVSLSCLTETKKVMKRKVREQVEESTDIGSYMSQHIVFSYRENRKPVSVDANYYNLADYSTDPKTKSAVDEVFFDGECPYPEFAHEDKVISEIILKIAMIQSRAREMKKQADKVVNEHSEKRCIDRDPTTPVKNNGATPSAYALPGHTSQNAVSMGEEAIHVPRLIQSNALTLFRAAMESGGKNNGATSPSAYALPGHTSQNAVSNGEEAIHVPRLEKSNELTLFRAAMESVTDETDRTWEKELNIFENTLYEVMRQPEPPLDSPPVKPPVAPVTRPRASRRKRKRQVSWTSSSASARRRSAAARRRPKAG